MFRIEMDKNYVEKIIKVRTRRKRNHSPVLLKKEYLVKWSQYGYGEKPSEKWIVEDAWPGDDNSKKTLDKYLSEKLKPINSKETRMPVPSSSITSSHIAATPSVSNNKSKAQPASVSDMPTPRKKMKSLDSRSQSGMDSGKRKANEQSELEISTPQVSTSLPVVNESEPDPPAKIYAKIGHSVKPNELKIEVTLDKREEKTSQRSIFAYFLVPKPTFTLRSCAGH